MQQLPDELLGAAAAVDLTIEKVMHHTDKTLLAYGTFDGQPAAIKWLLTPSSFWAAKWRHEIAVYHTFADSPPPTRAPRLLHTDDERLLVVEWLPGSPLDEDRYPQRTLTAAEIDSVLSGILAFNTWRAPDSRLHPIFDYADRFSRYHSLDYLTNADTKALGKLLDRSGPPIQINHGDPLASNILVDSAGVASLLDYEFTGLFLPGFDLAMLHTQLGAHTPALKTRIDDLVADRGHDDSFAVNLATVLTRELRMHHELEDKNLRNRRLGLLNPAWDEARQRLHRLALRRA